MYDVIVTGAGPAGLTAGLYTARAGLKTLVVEKLFVGGQAATTPLLENVPGFPEGITGPDYSANMQQQAERFGCEVRYAEALSCNLTSGVKTVTVSGEPLEARSVILACGASPRKLGLPREEELVGRGVSYCATCDGNFFREQTVAVVGGGDTAVEDALYLARLAKKVYLVHRRDQLRAGAAQQARLEAEPAVEQVLNHQPTAILGDEEVTGLTVANTQTGAERTLDLQGLFIAVGRVPDTAWLNGQAPLDEAGYLIADERMQTGIPGVFAAGDVRHKGLRQVVTALSDGAIAAWSAERYINEG